MGIDLTLKKDPFGILFLQAFNSPEKDFAQDLPYCSNPYKKKIDNQSFLSNVVIINFRISEKRFFLSPLLNAY